MEYNIKMYFGNKYCARMWRYVHVPQDAVLVVAQPVSGYLDPGAIPGANWRWLCGGSRRISF
jgi:hypothetical protein